MKPFLHGKKNLALAAARSPGALAVSPARPAAPGSGRNPEAAPSPNIEVVKEGDKVVRLLITCSCGERVEVECIYPAGA